tara:strand:- start:3167 stop:3892 length:726 start_codon:yes stop_codon:yes gene_type:complete
MAVGNISLADPVDTRQSFRNGQWATVRVYESTQAEVDNFKGELVAQGLNFSELGSRGKFRQIEVTFASPVDGRSPDTVTPENDLTVTWELDEQDHNVSLKEATAWGTISAADRRTLENLLENPLNETAVAAGDATDFQTMIKDKGITQKYATRLVIIRNAFAPPGWSGSFATSNAGKIYPNVSAFTTGESVPSDFIAQMPSSGVILKTGLKARQTKSGNYNLVSRFLHFDSYHDVAYDEIA